MITDKGSRILGKLESMVLTRPDDELASTLGRMAREVLLGTLPL